MLKGKTVVLGVTGGIAAYKACEVVSRLKKAGAEVFVIMTENAVKLVTPYTFETLSGNRVALHTFDHEKEFDVGHISYAKKADVFVVAPATANAIAKFANGIADDMLSTTALAAKCPKIVCPAMNTGMYDDPATEKNLDVLKSRGYRIVEPVVGELACGDVGKGKFAEPKDIVEVIRSVLLPKSDYAGRTVVVTAGATKETIDGVRFLSNESSGKMGVAIAERAAARGADVYLVYGSVTAALPRYIKGISVTSTQEMRDEVIGRFKDCDALIMAAAPADYRPKKREAQKIKKDSLVLELEKTPDIATEAGSIKGGRRLVVFAAETDSLTEHAKEKLIKKNADMIVANDVTLEGAGFGADTNIVTIINKNGEEKAFPKLKKSEVADIILDELDGIWSQKS